MDKKKKNNKKQIAESYNLGTVYENNLEEHEKFLEKNTDIYKEYKDNKENN